MTKAAAAVITHEVYRRTSLLFWRHTLAAAASFGDLSELLRPRLVLRFVIGHRFLLAFVGFSSSRWGFSQLLITVAKNDWLTASRRGGAAGLEAATNGLWMAISGPHLQNPGLLCTT